MIIPHSQLSREALTGVIEEFVSREGTDYGHGMVDMEQKCAQVQRQLDRGEAVLVFDQAEETINVVTREQAREMGL